MLTRLKSKFAIRSQSPVIERTYFRFGVNVFHIVQNRMHLLNNYYLCVRLKKNLFFIFCRVTNYTFKTQLNKKYIIISCYNYILKHIINIQYKHIIIFIIIRILSFNFLIWEYSRKFTHHFRNTYIIYFLFKFSDLVRCKRFLEFRL